MAASFSMDAHAQQSEIPRAAHDADVLFLGELHDNPAHHARQAHWTSVLQPQAIVFEMLTKMQAAKATSQARSDAGTLQEVLGWEESGWPDFDMYYPIFSAAPNAKIRGAAVPRDDLRKIMQADLNQLAQEQGLQSFGLDADLSASEQTKREALQREAHCNALPENLLAGMVNVQRVRDASLAHAALRAFEQFGGPVIVITGNGHARKDWGASFLLSQAAPDLAVFSLGQGEDENAPFGDFDKVIDAAGVARGDPCAAFK